MAMHKTVEGKEMGMDELRTAEVENLLHVFAAIDDEDAVFALLEDLFTIREIKDTSQRLAVARMLADGKPYTAIEAATGASATTIARVSKCVSYGKGGYAKALAALEAYEARAAAEAKAEATEVAEAEPAPAEAAE